MWHIWEHVRLYSITASALGVHGGGTAPTALQPLRWGSGEKKGREWEEEVKGGEGRRKGKGGNSGAEEKREG